MRTHHTLPALVFVAFLPMAAAAAPAGYVTSVLAGIPDPNDKVPAFNVVPGAGVATLSETTPSAILLHGATYNYLVSSQNASFAGVCTDSYTLTRVTNGQRVMLDSAKITKYSCKANMVYGWSIASNPVPDNPGPAILTGIVRFGGSTVRLSVPVMIQ